VIRLVLPPQLKPMPNKWRLSMKDRASGGYLVRKVKQTDRRASEVTSPQVMLRMFGQGWMEYGFYKGMLP
jgi:hypothetical protein